MILEIVGDLKDHARVVLGVPKKSPGWHRIMMQLIEVLGKSLNVY
jgi:hypothetical protein